MNILIIGDDTRSLELLALIVRQGKWVPMVARGLDEAIAQHERNPAEITLVEINSSLSDLLALCKALVESVVVPIIVISPWADETSQLRLYEAGANDCIPRPYSPRLLEAKIRAIRRISGGVPLATLPLLESEHVRVDPERHTVTLDSGKSVRLTPLEFRLFYTLLANTGHVLPAETLIYRIWGYTGEGNRDLLKGLVRRLRSKIEPDAKLPHYIRTIPGVGYSFSPTESNP